MPVMGTLLRQIAFKPNTLLVKLQTVKILI